MLALRGGGMLALQDARSAGPLQFVFHTERNKLLAQIETNFFGVTSLSLRTEDVGLFFWGGGLLFVFFLSFSDRDLCTKRELRIKDLTKTHQTQILVPRFTMEQHAWGGGRVGEANKCSNIQNTQKKSYLKVALSFCCTREEGNSAT